MKRSLSWRRCLLIFPVMLVLCLVIYQAVNLLHSEVGRYQTELFLDHWQQETTINKSFAVASSELKVALGGVESAIRRMPDNAALYVLQARVMERARLSDIELSDIGKVNNINPELEAWQRAVILRPAWPYSWSDYAKARSQYSLIDQPFEAALFRASQLGPWEPGVLENSAVLGFHYRGWLSDGLQAELDNSYQKLVKLSPHRARQIEQQYQ